MVDLTELAEGVSVGKYTLEHCIRHDSAGTFFAVLTDDGERLLLKLLPGDGPGAEDQFATWQRSQLLRHPHLQQVFDAGRAELAGSSYLYGVFEYPDEVLAAALENGPLSEAETRGVLEAALGALRYLHAQGLVHGAVTPDRIVAVGETVKLATDALGEPDERNGHAEDVRQLGELVRSLRRPEPLNEQFAAIVRHATAEPRQRWTLAEIARDLEPLPAVTATAPPMPVPAPPIRRDEVEPHSPRPFLAPAPPVRRDEVEPRPPGAFPKWIFAGVAILLLAILMFNLRRKPADVRPAPTPAPTAPPAMKALPPPPAVNAPPPAVMWRVIAYTYRSRNMAAKKAEQINARWPDLRAAVFTPKGRPGYYLVALGGGTNREEAILLQRKARGQGLPRDTYVQNYGQ